MVKRKVNGKTIRGDKRKHLTVKLNNCRYRLHIPAPYWMDERDTVLQEAKWLFGK